MPKIQHLVYVYIGLALALAGGAIVAIAMLAAWQQDGISKKTQIAVVKFETDHIFDALISKLSTMIFWQEAYDKTALNWDKKWVDYQFGPYLDSVNINLVAIFDGGSQLKFLHSHDLKAAPTIPEIAGSKQIRALVASVREAKQTLPPAFKRASVKIRGVTYFAAAGQIMPEDQKVLPIPESRTRIVIFLNKTGANAYSALEGAFGVSNLRVADNGSPQEISFPLTDAKGNVATGLWWIPERPGGKFLGTVLPLAAIVFLVLAGTLGLVVRRWQQLQQAFYVAEENAKLAREESLAKSAFIGTISHELRTPLNAILGFSDLMVRKIFGPLGARQYGEYAEHINTSGKSLLEIINDVIEISRIEGNETSVRHETMDLNIVLGDAIEKMTAKAEAKKIRLLLSHREAPVFASICPAGLREVLVRLLDNAIKFSAIGDVVEIEIEVDENILVRIRDHGIGIESSALARLGKPFVQVESHLHRSHGGIGLGLAISYGLARLMGCRIAIESELGVGSTVTIRLESNPAAVLQNQAA